MRSVCGDVRLVDEASRQAGRRQARLVSLSVFEAFRSCASSWRHARAPPAYCSRHCARPDQTRRDTHRRARTSEETESVRNAHIYMLHAHWPPLLPRCLRRAAAGRTVSAWRIRGRQSRGRFRRQRQRGTGGSMRQDVNGVLALMCAPVSVVLFSAVCLVSCSSAPSAHPCE